LLTYLQERVKEVLSGAGASTIVVQVYGPDLEVLRQAAQEIKGAIEGQPGPDGRKWPGKVAGVIDLKVESQVLVPELLLEFNPYRMAEYGLTPKQVADAVTTLLNGAKVGEVHQDQRAFDLVVVAHPEVMKTWHDLGKLEIDLPTAQGTVPLRAVADLRLVNSANTVRRDKASRCIYVACNVRGRDLGSVVRDIEERVRALPPREGYRVDFLGEY